MQISPVLQQNIDEIHELLTHAPDLSIRQFTIMKTAEQAAIVYLSNLTDKNSLNNNVLCPLQTETCNDGTMGDNCNLPVNIGQIQSLRTFSQVESFLLQGYSILFIDKQTKAYALDTIGWPQRAIEDPQLETSLRGAHQGFIEIGYQNIALIRRYIPSRELKIKELTVGNRGPTKIFILYLADVAHPEVLQELEDRIQRLNVDIIINTGELVELIEDNPYSPFPQFILTERPDGAASQILQGRYVVVVDRSPSVLVAPVTFISFLQTIDDYSMRWSIASFMRLLRFGAFIITIFLPAFYIAVISFNHDIIPFHLLLTIGEFRGRVPLPPYVEAVVMEISLEMLREAGVRLPSPIGQTVGIVGAIIIGQAIVSAGLVSNMMVVIVATTAIASFILPNYDFVAATRLLRFVMMLAAAIFGIVGIIIGFLIMIIHLIGLESLGTPYFSPFAPIRFADWKDTFIRLPLWKMDKRPVSTRATQLRRHGSNKPKRDGT